MDNWEWPREFWHLPCPWEAEEFGANDDLYDDDKELYTLADWEETDPSRVFLSLEELEDLEEEALWEEEFDPDDPAHLYLFMDQYEYLQQSRQPDLRELLEEDDAGPEDTCDSSLKGTASEESRDEP